MARVTSCSAYRGSIAANGSRRTLSGTAPTLHPMAPCSDLALDVGQAPALDVGLPSQSGVVLPDFQADALRCKA
jgi:hypothetical protein